MRIKAGFDFAFECAHPTPFLLMVNLRPEREADLITPQVFSLDPPAPLSRYLDGFGNICTRTVVQPGLTTFSMAFEIEDSGLPDPVTPDARQHPVGELPDEVIVFLLGSRYCETDVLSETAWSLFGHVEPGWGRVQAIVEYVHQRITFGYPSARATRTAHQAHQEQVGVCRDFAHLAVALCRCMNIPARYCTGYLGDIGIPLSDSPMDFSAWFEVYLGGRWHTFDARHNRPRIGRLLMAYGRDATDVAIATSFGPAVLVRFDVLTDEVG